MEAAALLKGSLQPKNPGRCQSTRAGSRRLEHEPATPGDFLEMLLSGRKATPRGLRTFNNVGDIGGTVILESDAKHPSAADAVAC